MKQKNWDSARQRGGFSRFELVLLGGVGALCCTLLWPVIAQNAAPDNAMPDKPEPLTDAQMLQKCQSNLKQIGLAVMQYTQDYDEQMPLASVRGPQNGDDTTTPIGWADAVLPYCRNTSIFQCPAESHPSSVKRVKGGIISDAAQLSGYTDYWYNVNLAGISLAQIESPAQSVLFGDGDGGAITSNARYMIDSLSPRWIKNLQSPVYRHGEGKGANYCFADGHVKFLPPDKITNKPPRLLKQGEATFEEGVGDGGQ